MSADRTTAAPPAKPPKVKRVRNSTLAILAATNAVALQRKALLKAQAEREEAESKSQLEVAETAMRLASEVRDDLISGNVQPWASTDEIWRPSDVPQGVPYYNGGRDNWRLEDMVLPGLEEFIVLTSGKRYHSERPRDVLVCLKVETDERWNKRNGEVSRLRQYVDEFVPATERVYPIPHTLGGPYELRRTGMFSFKVLGRRHCGTKGAMMTASYDARITTTSLDKDGFVCDQIKIADYFRDFDQSALSCELIAETAAHGIKSMIDAPDWTLALTISPQPSGRSGTAGVTVTLTDGGR